MDSTRKVLNLNMWFVPSFSSSLGKWTQLKESCDTEAVLPYNGRETTPTHLNAEDIKWISMHSSQTLELKDCSAVSNHYNTFRFFQWEWTLLVFYICLPFSQCQTNLRHQEVMKFRDSTLIKAAKFQGKRKLLSGWSLSSLGEDCACAEDRRLDHPLNRSPPFPSLLSNLSAQKHVSFSFRMSAQVAGWTPVALSQGQSTTSLVPINLISSSYISLSLLQHLSRHCTFTGMFCSLKAWISLHFSE